MSFSEPRDLNLNLVEQVRPKTRSLTLTLTLSGARELLPGVERDSAAARPRGERDSDIFTIFTFEIQNMTQMLIPSPLPPTLRNPRQLSDRVPWVLICLRLRLFL